MNNDLVLTVVILCYSCHFVHWTAFWRNTRPNLLVVALLIQLMMEVGLSNLKNLCWRF